MQHRRPLLIVPTYLRSNQDIKVLQKCLITAWESSKEQIFVVDDCSPVGKGTIAAIEEWAKTYMEDNIEFYVKEENEGFSKTVNIGLAKALAEEKDACLVNSDVEFPEKGWLDEIHKTEASIVGALLLYPNLTIQHAGIYFSMVTRSFEHRYAGSPPNLPAAQKPCDCPVTGALQYIQHDVLKEIGVYDPEFRLGYEDVDFMIRAIRAGFKSTYNPKVKAIHHESLFRKNKTDKIKAWENESLLRLLQKYEASNFKDVVPVML